MENEFPTPQQEPLINVIDPDTQQVGSIPQSQAHEALAQGYTQASPEQVDTYLKHQKYGTLGQEALTVAEGATSAATFGAVPGFGKKEDIRGRREETPIGHAVGQGLGLLGSSALIPGGGAAGLLGKVGDIAAEAIVPEGLGALSKIGSAAVKAAADNAAFQTGDELSKALTSDNPSQAIEDAIPNIGLAGLIGFGAGAGLGSINPLWKATMGGKVGSLLKVISDKAGGIDSVLPDALHETLETSGMHLSPEIKSALSSDPHIKGMFSQLQESTTESGVKAQEALKNFRSEAGEAMANAFGKTKEDIESLASLSEYDAGKKLQNTLAEELKAKIDPISSKYEEISEKFKDLELPQDRTIYQNDKNPYLTEEEAKIRGKTAPGTTSEISDQLGLLVQEKGYYTSPSSPEMQMINRILKEIPNLKTLEDLRNYQSLVGKNIAKEQLWDLGKGIRKVFASAEESVLDKAVGEKAPELLAAHAETKAAYKSARDLIDDLNDRLHVGKFGGPDTFLRSLKEMSPEDVLRRMSGKGDADLLKLVSEKFPQSAKAIKDYHVDNLLKNASSKAAPGEAVNTKNLLNAIQKMSPEMRAFALPAEAVNKVDAVGKLLEALPGKMNPSGTAKTLDALWSKIPSSAMAMTSMLTGHNPALGFLLGGLGKWIGRDIPDAIKLGLLKFLGSSKPIESEGFKSMVDLIHNTMKGQSLINKAAKNLFKAGHEVLPQAFIPSDKERSALDKSLMKMRDNPETMFGLGGKTGHYLPDHASAIGQYAANSVNYLNAQRPATSQAAPLDKPVEPTKNQIHDFNRTLNIAQQPLMVLQHLKDGTLNPKDIADFHALNPSLYKSLMGKITEEITNTMAKGDQIPHQLKMGLGLFMGQPLDSLDTPQALQSIQATFQQVGQKPSEKIAGNSFNKLVSMDETPLQKINR